MFTNIQFSNFPRSFAARECVLSTRVQHAGIIGEHGGESGLDDGDTVQVRQARVDEEQPMSSGTMSGYACAAWVATAGQQGPALGSDEQPLVLLTFVIIEVAPNKVEIILFYFLS